MQQKTVDFIHVEISMSVVEISWCTLKQHNNASVLYIQYYTRCNDTVIMGVRVNALITLNMKGFM